MSVEQMIEEIQKIYPKWYDLRLYKDDKIRAIYYNMRDRGRFDQPPEPRHTDEKYTKDKQMNIFDIWSREELMVALDQNKVRHGVGEID